MATYSQFPSPCGDYGSYQAGYLPTDETSRFVSVPLRGLWFLSPNYDARLEVSPNGVSVPLRGLWFLSEFTSTAYIESQLCFRPLAGIMVLIVNDYDEYIDATENHGFRPLAGIMVLIRTLYKCLYEAVEMAFCGADHIFSSFFVFCRKMIFKKLLRTEF